MINTREQLEQLASPSNRTTDVVELPNGKFTIGVMTGGERKIWEDAFDEWIKKDWQIATAITIAMSLVGEDGNLLMKFDPSDEANGWTDVRLILKWDFRLVQALSQAVAKLNVLYTKDVDEQAKNL